MNRIFTVLSAVLLSVSLWAQAPQQFSYQAVIRNSSNALVTSTAIGMKISLLQGTATGTAVYVETHTPTSNANGLVSISIGGGAVVSGTFASVDWANGPYFVKTETDPAGGTSYSLTTTSQLLSVPYAISSNNGFSRVSLTGDSLILTNGNAIIIPGISLSNHIPTSGYGPNITDSENNTYTTVYIGTQQWMAENLKVSKYSDGTAIPNITDNTQWSNLTSGAWSYYNNDVANNTKYGKLYNWYAVSPITNGNKNVCPTGWHVPTDAEWTVLTVYLGGTTAGGKMKEVSTTSWNSPNTDATNTSLFTGLPGGRRDGDGNYNTIGYFGNWWSSTENVTVNAWNRILYYGDGGADRNHGSKKIGLSVRCLRD